MAESSFKRALAWVRVSEGGNDDDPLDRGGRTSRGITQREYDAYCRMAGIPQGDVWKAPDGVVDDIYHRAYWLPYGPTLPPGPDYVFFDINVNSGLHEAVVLLQRALGVKTDGRIGVITSEALSAAKPAQLIDALCDARHKMYKAIEAAHPTDVKFDRGWMNRVEFARKNAHTLLGG